MVVRSTENQAAAVAAGGGPFVWAWGSFVWLACLQHPKSKEKKKQGEKCRDNPSALSPPLSTLYIRKIYSNIGTVRRIYIRLAAFGLSMGGSVGWCVCVA